jgi:hypothetical protein
LNCEALVILTACTASGILAGISVVYLECVICWGYDGHVSDLCCTF